MDLEEYFKTLSVSSKKVDELRVLLHNAIDEHNKVKECAEKEYINDNAKFKVGDVVRYAKSPNGKKFIVRDITCCTYWVCYPLTEHSKADIRYAVSTENGWKPNGGYYVDEDKLVKVG